MSRAKRVSTRPSACQNEHVQLCGLVGNFSLEMSCRDIAVSVSDIEVEEMKDRNKTQRFAL